MPSSYSCIVCATPLPSVQGVVTCPSCGKSQTSIQEEELTKSAVLLEVPSFSPDSVENVDTRTLPDEEFHAVATHTCTEYQKSPEINFPTIPGHEIISILGKGGMGIVYLARRLHTDDLVALKMMRLGSAASEDDKKRFLREAKALVTLKEHDHIVRHYSYHQTDEQIYFTMEFINGSSLSNLIHQQPLETRAAAQMFADLAGAVQHAHNYGLVHRDIKPANLLVEEKTGKVKLSDFGLVKSEEYTELTAPQVVLGTAKYMAPEQANGQQATASSDIYSLGISLYQSLAGKTPYDELSLVAILSQIANTPMPSVRQYLPKIDPVLEAILAKATSFEPSGRYGSAGEFQQDLRNWLDGKPTIARPLTPIQKLINRFKRNYRQTTVVVALLAMGGLGAAALIKPNRPIVQVSAPEPIDHKQVLHEKIRNLQPGEKLTIIGEKGLPDWYDWKSGPSLLATRITGDEACSFQTSVISLLELVEDAHHSEFEITAEIRHCAANGDTGSEVGLYFGFEHLNFYEGSFNQGSHFFTLKFSDYWQGYERTSKQFRDDHHVMISDCCMLDNRVDLPHFWHTNLQLPDKSAFLFSAVHNRSIMNRWRKLSIRFERDSATFSLYFDGSERTQTIPFSRLNAVTVNSIIPEDQTPKFSSFRASRSIGIYASDGIIAFRNVVFTNTSKGSQK
ncbi:MAG: protein kinase [Zavarzinella sp.]